MVFDWARSTLVLLELNRKNHVIEILDSIRLANFLHYGQLIFDEKNSFAFLVYKMDGHYALGEIKDDKIALDDGYQTDSVILQCAKMVDGVLKGFKNVSTDSDLTWWQFSTLDSDGENTTEISMLLEDSEEVQLQKGYASFNVA